MLDVDGRMQPTRGYWPAHGQEEGTWSGYSIPKLRSAPQVAWSPTRRSVRIPAVKWFNWLPDKQILDCPCHNSEYDPKAGGRLVSGPSPRGLAALPLHIADGNLMVRPFIGRLGIQQI